MLVYEYMLLLDVSVYIVVKYVFGGLIKVMVLELVRYKILVNVVVFGVIVMLMNGMDDSDVKFDVEFLIFLWCFGVMYEIVSLVVWFCLEGVNYIIGQLLIVDGGFMLVNLQFNLEQCSEVCGYFIG